MTIAEELIAIPHIGVQLGTMRGLILPGGMRLPLSHTRDFVPLSQLVDLQLIEGINGWSIRYWLALVVDHGDAGVHLRVAFKVRACVVVIDAF